MKQPKPPTEEELALHAAEDKRKKEELRTFLDEVIITNLSNWNQYSKRYFKETYGDDVTKWTKKEVSKLKWLISHGYYDEKQGHEKPEFPASTPPIGYLHSTILQGMNFPTMAHDITFLISPEVANSRMTEQAVRRYHDRFIRAHHYVTTEDAEKDRQLHRDRMNAEKKKRDHAEYMRKVREQEKKDKTEYWDPKEYVKKKEEERAKRKMEREALKKQAAEEFKMETDRERRAQKTRKEKAEHGG